MPNKNSGNDSQDSATNDGNNNTAQNRPLRCSPRHSSRQSATFGNNNREHNILQGLLQELSTPVRGESIENNEVAENDSEASMPKTLARLSQKACRAETRAMKAIQEEISCWYYYEKAYEESVEEIKNARRGVCDQSARNDNTVEHLPGSHSTKRPTMVNVLDDKSQKNNSSLLWNINYSSENEGQSSLGHDSKE